MTALKKEQIQTLVGLIVTTNPDQIACDDCFGQIGEFAEHALEGRELTDGMKVIEQHLTQCPCCKDEYEALLDALKELSV